MLLKSRIHYQCFSCLWSYHFPLVNGPTNTLRIFRNHADASFKPSQGGLGGSFGAVEVPLKNYSEKFFKRRYFHLGIFHFQRLIPFFITPSKIQIQKVHVTNLQDNYPNPIYTNHHSILSFYNAF